MLMLLMPVMFNYCILRTDCPCSNSGTCSGSGPRLHWGVPEIPYSYDPTGVPGTLTQPFSQTLAAAFNTWNAAAPVGYTGQGTESFGISAVYPTGSTSCDQSATDLHSTVGFMNSGWLCGPATIAITYTWFDGDGVIGEADMVLNGQDYNWTDVASPTVADTDLQSIVTHESGHYMGLGHSGVTTATMWFSVPGGETSKRSLDPDDIQAVGVVSGLQHGGGGSSSRSSCGCSLDGDRREARAGAVAGALLALIAIGAALFRRSTRRALAALALVAGATLAGGRDARATTMVRMDLPDLAAQSDVVAQGRIESVETKTDGRSIWTEQTFSVTRTLAGAAAGATLTIRTPGGTLPAGVAGPNGFSGLAVSGVPVFAKGDEALLFLAHDPRGVYGVVGFEQGRFELLRDGATGETRLHRDMSGVLRMVRTPEGGLAPAPMGDELEGIRLEDLAAKLTTLRFRAR